MAGDTGDRQDQGSEHLQGAAQPGVGEPAAQGDIFDQIAANIFTKRGLPAEPEWQKTIAEEFRIAMAALHVEVKPEGPPPDPKRTKNGILMLLLGAMENGDIWVLDTEVPVRKHDDGTIMLAGSIITFLCGQMDVEIQFIVNVAARHVTMARVLSIAVDGTRLTSDHHDRRWLASYVPNVELDCFSPALQTALDKLPNDGGPRWTVVGSDHLGRLYKWPSGGKAVVWKDARGREL